MLNITPINDLIISEHTISTQSKSDINLLGISSNLSNLMMAKKNKEIN